MFVFALAIIDYRLAIFLSAKAIILFCFTVQVQTSGPTPAGG